ncbi:MAG TPA: dethiobiotin synthase [Polyangiales bacterium]
MSRGLFITATGTSCGKTHVSRAITLAWREQQRSVAALKPIETGCMPRALDATQLADDAGDAALASLPDLYRAALPLSPYAVTLETGQRAPDLPAIAARIRELAAFHDLTVVEGAGGLLVPLDATRTIADLAQLLRYPLLLVAPDALGVLSHVLAAHECARARSLEVAAVILVQTRLDSSDPSPATNQRVLAERLAAPVLRFPHTSNTPTALIRAAHESGLVRLLGL